MRFPRPSWWIAASESERLQSIEASPQANEQPTRDRPVPLHIGSRCTGLGTAFEGLVDRLVQLYARSQRLFTRSLDQTALARVATDDDRAIGERRGIRTLHGCVKTRDLREQDGAAHGSGSSTSCCAPDSLTNTRSVMRRAERPANQSLRLSLKCG